MYWHIMKYGNKNIKNTNLAKTILVTLCRLYCHGECNFLDIPQPSNRIAYCSVVDRSTAIKGNALLKYSAKYTAPFTIQNLKETSLRAKVNVRKLLRTQGLEPEMFYCPPEQKAEKGGIIQS